PSPIQDTATRPWRHARTGKGGATAPGRSADLRTTGVAADLVEGDDASLVDGPADEQAGEGGVAGLGERQRGRGRLARAGGVEERLEGQPGVGLGARVEGLAGPRAIAEGHRARAEVDAAGLAHDLQGDAREPVVGGGDPALEERDVEAAGPLEL